MLIFELRKRLNERIVSFEMSQRDTTGSHRSNFVNDGKGHARLPSYSDSISIDEAAKTGLY